ncbi:hypothetical protein ACB098_03G037200 [Castanea mollissima]
MLYIVSCLLFYVSYAHNTSSTFSRKHCLPDQSTSLLQLRQEFEKGMSSDHFVQYHGSYPKMKSWKNDIDCCSWDGVTCNTKTGQVVGLNLSYSWLYGPLSPKSNLFNLHHLQKLDLSYNDFNSSTIPSTFKYDNMGDLHPALVNISSSMPQSLVNFSSLTSVSLFLPKIQAIDFSGNKFLIGFLPEFRYGSPLKELHLSRTRFSGKLPSSIGNLKALNGNLTQLLSLDLSHNYFDGGFPIFLTNLTKLIIIYISSNQLTGPIPSEISRFSNLYTLDLSRNSLTGSIPLSLFTMVSLSDLYLDQNQLDGPLNFENVSSNLKSLELGGNKLIELFPSLSSCNLHEFPDFLKDQNELAVLDLSNNKIEGKVPKWFWNVGKETLIYLDLSHNSLSIFEQPPILPWKMMNFLDLRSNKLGGSLMTLPLSLSLQVLDMSNNQLIGQIPQFLNLRNNRFHRNLPETFIEGSNLKTLDFNYNQIQGKIPRSLVKCRMLEVLNLRNNNMNDTFPFCLESLPELSILILRGNRFHGAIWDAHTNFEFSKLRVIDLSHNRFSGKLPSQIHNTSKPGPEWISTIFTSIDLSNNRFHGINFLNLSSNSFTSLTPSSLGILIEFESLVLSQNELSGEIPQELTSLTFLEYLNLSRNNLKAPIPQNGQFGTFENSSFEGNLRLCGFPLTKKCESHETPTPKSSQEASLGEAFDWIVVIIGYACGLVIGLVTGHVITSTRPTWFVKTFGVNLQRRR